MALPSRLAVTFMLCATLVSCSSDDSTASEKVTVFATASLVDAFTEIATAFETANPDVRIEFNFASSSDLATQIIEGAPADVFASADVLNIERVDTSGETMGNARTFATNSLAIMVEAGNPQNIRELSDLDDPNLVYITCDESVPIGRYTAEVLARANVSLRPKSYEESVKGIVNRIVLGEADAGIVYRTDVIAAGSSAEGIPIPDDLNVVATYPIATIGDEPSATALAFVEFVVSSDVARSILRTYGFGAV